MKKDKFACINETKKHGKVLMVAIAIIALCIAGGLCALKLQAENSTVVLDGSSISLESGENNNS